MVVPSFRRDYSTAVKDAIRRTDAGFVLVESETGIPLAIVYTAIQNTIRRLLPCTLEFLFEDDRGLWQVHIVGCDSEEARDKMRPLQMRLITGKRETLHAGNREIIRDICVTKIEQEEEGE
jgi:hypothetical protein